MENRLGRRLLELPGPILLTGHTGFKGTWMTLLLEYLKVPVIGYSLPPAENSLFNRTNRIGAIPERFADVRDYNSLENFLDEYKPAVIIHMAAQPLVLKSYENPRETFDVNVMGTVNILDIALKKEYVKAVIVVTTDKVYRNDNSGKSFIETDPLEGKDPYSASKVGAEAVVAAWQQLVNVSGGPAIISVRAGNVIGGGDASSNRLIPDLVQSFMNNKAVSIRNPSSSRPWQHVLDPISGYLTALQYLLSPTYKEVAALNFAHKELSLTVSEVVEISRQNWPRFTQVESLDSSSAKFYEAKSLGLNPQLAYELLGWSPVWSQETAIHRTISWWADVLLEDCDPLNLCLVEIKDYLKALELKTFKNL